MFVTFNPSRRTGMQIEADHRRRGVSPHVELVHFHSEHDEQAAVRQVAVLASLRQPLGRYRRSVSRYCVCEFMD